MKRQMEIEILEDRCLATTGLNPLALSAPAPAGGPHGQQQIAVAPSPMQVLGQEGPLAVVDYKLACVGGVRGNHNETLLAEGRGKCRRRRTPGRRRASKGGGAK